MQGTEETRAVIYSKFPRISEQNIKVLKGFNEEEKITLKTLIRSLDYKNN